MDNQTQATSNSRAASAWARIARLALACSVALSAACATAAQPSLIQEPYGSQRRAQHDVGQQQAIGSAVKPRQVVPAPPPAQRVPSTSGALTPFTPTDSPLLSAIPKGPQGSAPPALDPLLSPPPVRTYRPSARWWTPSYEPYYSYGYPHCGYTGYGCPAVVGFGYGYQPGYGYQLGYGYQHRVWAGRSFNYGSHHRYRHQHRRSRRADSERLGRIPGTVRGARVRR